jgi:hypothetical protein
MLIWTRGAVEVVPRHFGPQNQRPLKYRCFGIYRMINLSSKTFQQSDYKLGCILEVPLIDMQQVMFNLEKSSCLLIACSYQKVWLRWPQ